MHRLGRVIRGQTRLNMKKPQLSAPVRAEMVSENPDTTILLTNGKHLIVRETTDEVVEKIREERRNIVRELLGGAGPS